MKHLRTITITLIAALTFTATASAAHYMRENVLTQEGAKIAVTGSGTLKYLTVVGGSSAYTCRTAIGGWDENPVGGGAGIGAIELYSSYQCTFTACPTYPELVAEALPWPEELTGGTDRTSGIKLNFECWASKADAERAARGGEGVGESPRVNARTLYVATLNPKVETGTSASHPSFLEFGTAAGKYEQEGSLGAILGEAEGKIKLGGYKESELIAVQ